MSKILILVIFIQEILADFLGINHFRNHSSDGSPVICFSLSENS